MLDRVPHANCIKARFGHRHPREISAPKVQPKALSPLRQRFGTDVDADEAVEMSACFVEE
jgi:hypothetical protein